MSKDTHRAATQFIKESERYGLTNQKDPYHGKNRVNKTFCIVCTFAKPQDNGNTSLMMFKLDRSNRFFPPKRHIKKSVAQEVAIYNRDFNLGLKREVRK